MKTGKKTKAVDELTTQEREAVTIVFHQYETGLREDTIFTKVRNILGFLSYIQNLEIYNFGNNSSFQDLGKTKIQLVKKKKIPVILYIVDISTKQDKCV